MINLGLFGWRRRWYTRRNWGKTHTRHKIFHVFIAVCCHLVEEYFIVLSVTMHWRTKKNDLQKSQTTAWSGITALVYTLQRIHAVLFNGVCTFFFFRADLSRVSSASWPVLRPSKKIKQLMMNEGVIFVHLDTELWCKHPLLWTSNKGWQDFTLNHFLASSLFFSVSISWWTLTCCLILSKCVITN